MCQPKCSLCGNENASIRFLFPKWSSSYEENLCYFLCKNCYKKLTHLINHIENRILSLHEANYISINNRKEEIFPIKKEFYIVFNPSKTRRKGNHRNGNGLLKGDVCAFCGATTRLTVHHPLKRSVFGENNEGTITLCEKCHREIERKIRKMEISILDKVTVELRLLLINLLISKEISFKDNRDYIIPFKIKSD